MNVFCDKDKSLGGPETIVLFLFLFSGLNKNSCVEVIIPSTQNVAVFGDRAFK